MQLDSFTILAAGCALLILLGLVFVVLWARDRRATWLLWWGLPLIMSGLALGTYTRPNWEADFLSIVAGNSVRIFALGCLWQGVRVFQGRKPALLELTAICAVWVLACLVPAVIGNMTVRIEVVSLLNALLCALAAHELWRDRGEKLSSRWPLFAVFTSFAILMALRAIAAPFAPFPIGSQPVNSAWLGIFVWVTFGHATFGAVLFLAMTMERREAEQRNFALSDPLTGLLNRRAFSDFASRTNRRRAGLRNALAILVLDLDHFKAINDRFGHEAGDRMLKSFAELAEANVRPSDQLFRMGGEEFCFALPETSLTDAINVAERIRKVFEGSLLETASGPARATVSIGIAATQHSVDVEVLLAAADAAVYEAKARGRNRVVVAEPASLLRAQLNDITGPTRMRA